MRRGHEPVVVAVQLPHRRGARRRQCRRRSATRLRDGGRARDAAVSGAPAVRGRRDREAQHLRQSGFPFSADRLHVRRSCEDLPGLQEFFRRQIILAWNSRITTQHVDGVASAVAKLLDASGSAPATTRPAADRRGYVRSGSRKKYPERSGGDLSALPMDVVRQLKRTAKVAVRAASKGLVLGGSHHARSACAGRTRRRDAARAQLAVFAGVRAGRAESGDRALCARRSARRGRSCCRLIRGSARDAAISRSTSRTTPSCVGAISETLPHDAGRDPKPASRRTRSRRSAAKPTSLTQGTRQRRRRAATARRTQG